MKPRMNLIWLGYKKMDGSDDKEWLDIEYDNVPSYCLYCKMLWCFESQCWTRTRNDRIKNQKEEQAKKEVATRKEDNFQTVSKRKSAKAKQNLGDGQVNKGKDGDNYANIQHNVNDKKYLKSIKVVDNQQIKMNKGISIKEPEDTPKITKIDEVPGKGKGKMGDVQQNVQT